MCTVSYLPNNFQSFTLTSNRDELTERQSDSPQIFNYNSNAIIFPKDKRVFGSWIAMSKERVICILNGGFKSHQRKKEYRKSRGILVLDALIEKGIEVFIEDYDLSDIEPFTLIWVDLNPSELFELIWDGIKLHKKQLDVTKAYFWSSSTLYNAEWRIKRERWFTKWLQENDTTANSIRDFHLAGGEQNESYGFIMSRNNGALKTISVTQILFDEALVMRHLDLIDNKTFELGF